MVTLMLLLIVTIIALSAVRFSTSGARSALNDEYRAAAFRSAQSLVSAATSLPSNTPVVGSAGYTICTPNITSISCNQSDLALPNNLYDASSVQVTVTRMAPDFSNPPRAFGSSANLFFAATFGVNGSYDMSSSGQGRAQINQGLMLILPRG